MHTCGDYFLLMVGVGEKLERGQTVDWSRLSEAVWGCFSMVFFA
jgi:hypothetical protein